MLKLILKERQKIFIFIILAVWAVVIFFKQGGLSLVIHYSWPFLLAASFILLYRKTWLINKNSWLHVLTFIMIGVYLATFFFDLTPSDGSLELMNITGGLLLVLILSQTKFEEKNIEFLYWGMILTVAAADIWGMIIYAAGHPFTRLAGPLFKQYESFSGYPNLLANLNLAVIIPGFLLLNNINKNKRLKLMLIFVLNIIIFAGLILTYSRAAWLAGALVAVSASVFFLIKYKNQKQLSLKFIKNAVLIIVIGLLLTALINGIRGANDKTISIGEKITFTSEDEGSSISERIASFQRGVIMSVSHPLTGVGAGSFNYISQSFEKDFETLSSYPYSLPVKIFAENGILFFVLLAIWIIRILASGLTKHDKFKTAAALTVIMLLIHHSIDNNFDFFSASLPFYLFLGLIWPEKDTKSLFNNAWIISLMIIMILSGVIFTVHESWYGRFYTAGRDAAGAQDHENGYINYEKSEQLIFPKDARMASAISAYELFKTTGNAEWIDKSKQKILDYEEKDNLLDARAPMLLAQISYEQKNYEQCINFAQKAKIKGGGNNFTFDYFEITCANELNDTERLKKLKKEIKPRLEKYLELLKNNSHMTVLTDNPKYAIKILDILRKQNYDEFEGLYEEMYAAAVTEIKKFHEKYGIKMNLQEALILH